RFRPSSTWSCTCCQQRANPQIPLRAGLQPQIKGGGRVTGIFVSRQGGVLGQPDHAEHIDGEANFTVTRERPMVRISSPKSVQFPVDQSQGVGNSAS
ncbi:MAG TPA: hypothetical protein VEK14_08305, partial [Rhodomicrobium sp.]|nr:hypothetical protein [Rhodomicrobium sp.]